VSQHRRLGVRAGLTTDLQQHVDGVRLWDAIKMLRNPSGSDPGAGDLDERLAGVRPEAATSWHCRHGGPTVETDLFSDPVPVLDSDSDRQRLLFDLSDALLSTLDLEAILHRTSRRLLEEGLFRSLLLGLVSHDGGFVELRTNYWCRTDPFEVVAEDLLKGRRIALDHPTEFIALVARSGRMEVVEGWDERFGDRQAWEQERGQEFPDDKVSYFLPILRDGRAICVAATASTRSDKEQTLGRIARLQPLFRNLALAVEHAWLHEQSQEAAAQLQQVNARLQSEIEVRREAERQLRLSEGRLRQAMGLARLGRWDWDLRRDTVEWSAEMFRIYGIDPDSFTGHGSDYLECTHPDDRASQVGNIEKGLADARGQVDATVDAPTSEFRLRRPDGVLRTVRGSARVLTDKTGEPRWMLGVLQDITEERAVQDRLLQAQKMDALGRLAAGVAHDFNNLLTAIQLNGESLREELPESDELRDMLATTQRAAGITGQLLTFSRQQVTSPTTLRPAAAVEEMRALLRSTAGDRNALHLSCEGDGSVRIDPTQLSQLVLNLVLNARDAVSDTGGRIDVSVRDAPHEVVLVVRDDGSGMDETTRLRAFEPFFTTKEAGHGTGLGLSTVHGIVEQWQGRLQVDSAPGEGTIFTVAFPAVRAVDRQAGGPAATQAQAPRYRGHVVLVEDEEAVRASVARLLTALGFEVQSHETAETARQALEAGVTCDLLLTDLRLPGMSGLDLCLWLQRHRRDVPLLIMSGHVGVVDLPESIAFLAKPFTVSDLRSRLDELLFRPSV
jgi:two-component system cell cycle sensor histidine kinase/response regulator CckA